MLPYRPVFILVAHGNKDVKPVTVILMSCEAEKCACGSEGKSFVLVEVPPRVLECESAT